MLCDHCKQREATIFISHGGEPGTSRRLCEACHLELASPVEMVSFKQFTEAFLNGKCEYCGAPAAGGGGGGGLMPGTEMHLNFWCQQCGEDLREFLLREENDFISDFPHGDLEAIRQLALRLADVERRKEEYMKRKVAERGPAQAAPGRRLCNEPFEQVAAKLAAADPRYAKEAYLFVRDGLDLALMNPNPSGPLPRHVGAAELLQALRALALKRFGGGARAQLAAWGIHGCPDFGEIVYILINNGIFGKNEQDKREDFDGGYDFAAEFPADTP